MPAMGSFPPKQQQPDEGYSEAPLNSSVPEDISTILSTLRSPTDLPAWLAANPSILPESLKKGILIGLQSAADRRAEYHEQISHYVSSMGCQPR